ncbi:MAG TPA: phosphotransferase [Thermomicrobiales bacterium]|nr:phosphotransferase [Thermomicrobiales bacterium]
MIESLERDIVTHWAVFPPVRVEPFLLGANNTSYMVSAAKGTYVLKWYRNTNEPQWLRFEHGLLDALAHANLPFAVPEPVPTLSGASHVEATCGPDTRILVLFRLILGRAAVFCNVPEANRSGHALAVLDEALAQVSLDPSIVLPNAFDDLSSIHIRVPRPFDAVGKLTGTDQVAHLMSATEDRWHRVTVDWRSQLIHGDFYPSNTLVSSGEVSGILDFEFSGLGFRVMDFAVGLAAFSTKDWERDCAWDALTAFASGYLERTPFTETELAAIPTMMLKRETTSLVHWLGRLEEGLTTLDDMHSRIARLLALERWLEGNEARLLDCLDRINR